MKVVAVHRLCPRKSCAPVRIIRQRNGVRLTACQHVALATIVAETPAFRAYAPTAARVDLAMPLPIKP